MTLKDSADEMTFDLLEVPIVDKDIEGAVDNVTLDGNQYTDYLWLKKQFIQKWSILCDDEYTRLRGFYTRQFENADVPSYRLYYGDDIIRNSTLSGERIELSISGVADGTMSLTQMDGNTEQTTYTGKNLFNATGGTTTVNGVTFTKNADGTYKANGTSTGFIAYTIGKVTFTSATSVTYSGCPVGGSMSTYSLNLQKDDGAVWLIDETGSGQTATLEANKAYSVRLVIRTGVTVNNIIYEPMVRLSSISDSSYEPYVGGQPSPSPTFPQPVETVTGRQTVGIVGKNLYDPNSTVFSVPANVSVEVDGDSVKVTALITTTSSNLYWRTPIPDAMLEDGKTYTISSVLGNGAYRSLRLLLRNHDGSNAGFSTGFSVTYDSRYTLFVVENPFATTGTTQVTAGTTCTISNIQVEEGSTATTYEPYNGQNYEINLGKNLFDKDNPNVVRGYIAGTNLTGGTDYTIYIPCEESTTYTIQKMVAVPQTANRFRINSYATEPTAGSTSISSSYFWNAGDGSATTTHTYTTPVGAKYLGITVMTANTSGTTTADEMYASIQIEKGYTASSYSAYFEPIELCKIGTYQDRIYKENGKWWLEKQTGKVVLNGSEDWHKSGNTQVDRYWYNIYSGDVVPSFHQIYSDKFFYEYNVPTVNAMWVDVYQTLERLFVNYAPYGTTAVADLKTWLASNPTTVYYPLATPTTTEITNEALVEELEALQDEAISVGLHNIYTDTPNALPTLTFDLTEYLSKSTTIIPETAVRLTLTDGGVINACGCRKDVQLTMRETIE